VLGIAVTGVVLVEAMPTIVVSIGVDITMAERGHDRVLAIGSKPARWD
jgi:hypothetical protein